MIINNARNSNNAFLLDYFNNLDNHSNRGLLLYLFSPVSFSKLSIFKTTPSKGSYDDVRLLDSVKLALFLDIFS